MRCGLYESRHRWHRSESRLVVSNSLWPHGLYSPWNSPSQNTGVGGHSLLQGIFPTQGWNTGLPHCRWILYQVSHQGSPNDIGLNLNSSDRISFINFCFIFLLRWSLRKTHEIMLKVQTRSNVEEMKLSETLI